MKAPYFWSGTLDPYSREAAPVTRALLTPFAALYRAITAYKLRRATPLKVAAPVICIGNLTVGGTGKTPLARALRDHLTGASIRAATLSRGHGGKLRGPIRVDENVHTARQVGDEPLMLSQTGEAWISRDRAAGAAAMVEDGVACIIMDDGHQNPGLHKDLSIIVIDAEDPFGNGFIVPKGPLREPVAEGLARADSIVLMQDGPVPAHVKASGLPTYRAALRLAADLPDGPLLAFAGIGRPEKFFDSLRAAGGDIRDTCAYADHHVYTDRDLTFLKALAAEHQASLVTTEKDLARIQKTDRAGISALPARLAFDEAAAPGALIAAVMRQFEPNT